MEFNNSLNYKVSYRNIKYPRVELKTGKLLFILPFGYNSNILYEKHKNWIFKKINFIEECLVNAESKELAKRSDEEFKKLIYSFIKKISIDLEIKTNQTYFRKMRTKWASLSSVRNLTVNKFMKYLPEYLIEYIIFHELVHVIEKNHNNRFWEIISEKHKNYQKLEKELFEYWFKVSDKVGLLQKY
jgi:predicted metal-dependent hydrolase